MHILVTRPIPDAWETQAQIEKLGHQASLAPLLEIELVDLTLESFDGASAIVVTSQNALRSLSFSGLVDKVSHLQVYAVGEATAKLAQELKLRNITAGRGGAADLVPVVVERQTSRKGKVLHLAGDHKAFDMTAALAAKGIVAEDVLAYRQIAASSLPGPVVALLKAGRLGAVTLYSPRTAEVWAGLVKQYGLQTEAKSVPHLCLSDAVAAKLPAADELQIQVAAEPTGREIVALIKGLAAGPRARVESNGRKRPGARQRARTKPASPPPASVE